MNNGNDIFGESEKTWIRRAAFDVVRTRNLPVSLIEDLVSAGMTGLFEAKMRFRTDNENKISFRSFASFRVRGEMLDFVRSEQCLSLENFRRIRGILEAGEVRRVPRKRSERPLPRDIFEYAHEAARNFQIDSASSGYSECPETTLQLKERRERILNAISKLSPMQKTTIQRRYFEGTSFTEIAQSFGLSRSWVSRQHRAAIRILKKNIVPDL